MCGLCVDLLFLIENLFLNNVFCGFLDKFIIVLCIVLVILVIVNELL